MPFMISRGDEVDIRQISLVHIRRPRGFDRIESQKNNNHCIVSSLTFARKVLIPIFGTQL